MKEEWVEADMPPLSEAKALAKLFADTKREMDALKPWQKTNKVPMPLAVISNKMVKHQKNWQDVFSATFNGHHVYEVQWD